VIKLELTTLIKQSAGLKPNDLKLETETEYTELINYFINATKSWINRYTKKKYTDTSLYPEYPADLELVLIEIIVNLLGNTSLRQDMPTIDNENYKLLQAIDSAITDEIKFQLKPFKRGNKSRMFVIGNKRR
jgi:hypothetical protein